MSLCWPPNIGSVGARALSTPYPVHLRRAKLGTRCCIPGLQSSLCLGVGRPHSWFFCGLHRLQLLFPILQSFSTNQLLSIALVYIYQRGAPSGRRGRSRAVLVLSTGHLILFFPRLGCHSNKALCYTFSLGLGHSPHLPVSLALKCVREIVLAHAA